MEITRFLAMTGAEFAFCPVKPAHIAWMACHFSPYCTGLSNLPPTLPRGSMLILNDRIPICGHDPEQIARELQDTAEELQCDSILLDFQRENEPATAHLVQHILKSLPCPVAVSDLYAGDLDCPVFLPPPPPDEPLARYIALWSGREIWLEAALDTLQLEVTEKGCTSLPLPYCPPDDAVFRNAQLCCSYRHDIRSDAAIFTLWRTPDDLTALLDQAGELGVTRAIGLYQQLKEGPLP